MRCRFYSSISCSKNLNVILPPNEMTFNKQFMDVCQSGIYLIFLEIIFQNTYPSTKIRGVSMQVSITGTAVVPYRSCPIEQWAMRGLSCHRFLTAQRRVVQRSNTSPASHRRFALYYILILLYQRPPWRWCLNNTVRYSN